MSVATRWLRCQNTAYYVRIVAYSGHCNTLFGARLTQLDLRFNRPFQIGRVHVTGKFDVFGFKQISDRHHAIARGASDALTKVASECWRNLRVRCHVACRKDRTWDVLKR
jgi:hypothetical protein